MPVLRAKASEWDALSRLSPAVRRRIAPIIEFVPDWKAPGATTSTRKRRAPRTQMEYVTRFLESLAKATPSDARAFVYFGHAGTAALWNGIDLWETFASGVPAASRIIPIVDLTAAPASPKLVLLTQTRGAVALRIEAPYVGPALATQIASALKALGVAAGSAHMIVDLKDQPALRSHVAIRTALGHANAFASVTVLAGVFPQDLTNYQPGVAAEHRTEWQTWWREHIATAAADQQLGFGDYTTQCARYRPSPEVPGSVSLRYTTDDAILVFRGRQSNNATGLGHNQMHGHCRLLVNRAEYDGAAFSWGDHRFHCWTNPANGPGNAPQWRTASLVHHMTHVVGQLQDPVGSSATLRAWARGQAPGTCR